MALIGNASLAIWHGLQAGCLPEFERYHTIEHMPERLGIPGFLRGRRYMGESAGELSCFTLYEATHVEVFRSPQYLARLNAPTDWTRRIQPSMKDFLRGACDVECSLGAGVGSAVRTYRMRAEPGVSLHLASAAALGGRLMMLEGVCGAHVLRHRTDVASAPTGETNLRPSASTEQFDALLVIEAIDAHYLLEQTSLVEKTTLEARHAVVGQGSYLLSYLLEAPRL